MSAREKDDDLPGIISFLNREPDAEIVVNRLENDYGLDFNDIDHQDGDFPEGARVLKEYASVKLLETENHRYAEGIY